MLAEREPETWPVLPLAAPCAQVSSAGDPQNASKYCRARYYDPKIGRFISEDPIGFSGGLNFYAYVDNSPAVRMDPSGLVGFGPLGGGSGTVGVGSLAAAFNVSFGAGFFFGGKGGWNAGSFLSGGSMIGGPGYGGQGLGADPLTGNADPTNRAVGAQAGGGFGFFYTNATSACQLQGKFDTRDLDTPWFSLQYGKSPDGTYIWGLTFGPGVGGAVSRYPTDTALSESAHWTPSGSWLQYAVAR